MKKFILFNSPIFEEPTDAKEEYLSPIGLAYIATYLEKSGIEVKLVDCVKERLGVREVNEIINNAKPDFVGVNIFSQNYELVKKIIENIQIPCECFIGGQAVKSIYDDILRWNIKNKTYIIIGEAEFIISDIVSGKCEEMPSVQLGNKFVYRVDKESKYFPKDLSSVSLERKYLKDEVITNHYGQKEASIITSRGCVYNCAFCGGASGLNKDVYPRVRNKESVISEIEEILARYPDITSIRVLDDLFLRTPQSIDDANQIFATFPQLTWRGMVHALTLVRAIDKIEGLKRNGCKELFMGIESGSEKIRKKINKLGSVCDIIKVAKALLENGIDLKGYFIYGFPGETKQDFEETYKLAYGLKEISTHTPGVFRTSVFQFRPYHGTQLYEEIMQGTGLHHGAIQNSTLGQFEGRQQFNFNFGNYSAEPTEVLNEYIIKTQRLSEDF